METETDDAPTSDGRTDSDRNKQTDSEWLTYYAGCCQTETNKQTDKQWQTYCVGCCQTDS